MNDDLPTVGDVDVRGTPAPVAEIDQNPFGLTERELQFAYACVELDDRAAAAATLDAKQPHKLAALMWSKPRVRRMVDHLAQLRGGAQSVQASDIINRLAAIAEANVLDAFTINKSGKLQVRQIHEMPPALLAAVKRIVVKKGVIEIELHDKLRAMELIGRYQGLWSGKAAADTRPVQAAPRTPASSYEERLAQLGNLSPGRLAGPTIDVPGEPA